MRRRTLPLLHQHCEIPKRIAMLTYANLTGERDNEIELGKVIKAIHRSGGAANTTPQVQGPTTNTTASSSTPWNDDHAEEIKALREQIRIKQRRLHERQLQAARYGISTDPAITIEIEDLESEITTLQRRLQALS